MATAAMKLKDTPWKGRYDKPIKKKRHHFANKVCLIKAMDFPVVMYEYENLIMKEAECVRNEAFKLWSWRRFLAVLWTARRSNQSS